jgi:hypothetical protein
MCVYGQVVRKMASKIKGEWEMILNTVQANRSCEQKLQEQREEIIHLRWTKNSFRDSQKQEKRNICVVTQ